MTARSIRALLMGAGLLLPGAMSLAKMPQPAVPSSVLADVEVRRTSDGIPHLRAHGWHGLGVGVGYVQAQDALCTLAEAFITYEGRRAWFFGADGRPARDATFGRPKNLDLDFFFRAFADDAVIARYREAHPRELNELVDGFAAGNNRYLADARAGRVRAPGRSSCLKKAWVRAITADDIHRRMYAAQIAAGYAKFIGEIAGAAPPQVATSRFDAAPSDATPLRARLAQRIGAQPGIGSNAMAFGRVATGGEGAVLFGNPHWYWGGPDRFYQMHLTIPGKIDVAGVAFLGVPVVMIGFNNQVAWSHTVSQARRFGLFNLALDAADPTRYLVDGRSEPMTARTIEVEVRGGDGKARRLARTFYGSRFGPVLDLGEQHGAFRWGTGHALAIRDVNAENFRVFRNFFYWNQAKSLEDFIAIQHREAAVPWVNTVAIGRGDGRVWWGDVGAVPNAPDDLRKLCATSLSASFAQVDPRTPVLDGSRSSCDWRIDLAAVQRGAMPVARLPWLLREDYVANMNDSYWLTNARQPLEGFASLLGGEREPLELRGRFGHRLALDVLRAADASSEGLSRRLMRDVLTPRAYSAQLFKDQVLRQACEQAEVTLDTGFLKAPGLAMPVAPPAKVDVAPACDVLRNWSGKADAGDRGALLWDALWSRLEATPIDERWGVPFSSDAPLDTPRDLRAGGGAARALAATVLEFRAKGWPLDGTTGSRRYVLGGGHRIPIHGGCHSAGYFSVVCNEDGRSRMGPDTLGNSYLQVVRFGASDVEAHTLLAHGQDEAALSRGPGMAPVLRYSGKQWLRFPFRDEDIERDPKLQRVVLRTAAPPPSLSR